MSNFRFAVRTLSRLIICLAGVTPKQVELTPFFIKACPAKHTNGINNSLIRRQFRDAEIGLFCFHNRIESNHLLHLSCIMISRKDMDQVLYIQTDECLIGVAKRKAACIEKIINMHIAVRLHQFI